MLMRALLYILKHSGIDRLKMKVWDAEYMFGHWSSLCGSPEMLTFLKENVASDSAILGMGCGEAGVLAGLREGGWNGFYCGVDVSAVAV
jgi:hypothetical protein